MNRPGLEELETLMKHAESLPVDSVDGQAYLRCVCSVVAAFVACRRGNVCCWSEGVGRVRFGGFRLFMFVTLRDSHRSLCCRWIWWLYLNVAVGMFVCVRGCTPD